VERRWSNSECRTLRSLEWALAAIFIPRHSSVSIKHSGAGRLAQLLCTGAHSENPTPKRIPAKMNSWDLRGSHNNSYDTRKGTGRSFRPAPIERYIAYISALPSPAPGSADSSSRKMISPATFSSVHTAPRDGHLLAYRRLDSPDQALSNNRTNIINVVKSSL
jgi:hypothetical protein